MPDKWTATLVVEGEPTSDGRMIAAGAVGWRELPLTLMAQTTTAPGHDGAVVAGRIDEITREGNVIVARGIFDDSDTGAEISRMVASGVLRGVSVDMAVDEWDLADDSVDGGLIDSGIIIRRGTILGATITPFPAFAQATISPDAETVVASLSAPYPVEMFENPGFDGPTPFRVLPNGRVMGHVATWGTCHVGITNECVQPPVSKSDYAFFMTGEIETSAGRIPVGTITMDTSHASLDKSRIAAARHYDDTGTAAAYVQVGEDEWGIWASGVVAPGLSDDRITRLGAAKLSGDWRNVSGNLEMVAVLAVNTPGFMIPRARVASQNDGSVGMSVVSAGALVRDAQRTIVNGEIRFATELPVDLVMRAEGIVERAL